jgi:catechol 2,3-dioxygenase-like lactoylglutathione lyase family enzyme
MITNIRHTVITVNNLEKTITFFIDTLGLKLKKKMNERGTYIDNMLKLDKVKVTTAKLKAPDGNLIELLKFKNYKDKKKWSGKLYSTGLTHMAFSVKNLDKSYKILKKKGVFFNAPPQLSPDGFAKVTFCKGPENFYIELVEEL